VQATDNLIHNYNANRPDWLKPKEKQVVHIVEKEFDPNRGISKAEQEEMLDRAVFNNAKAKADRGEFLRNRFLKNKVQGKLKRVKTDLALNRVGFELEYKKLKHLDDYFDKKINDPNLNMSRILAANPTEFFQMVHRRLKAHNYRPGSYEDILMSLTPEQDDSILTSSSADFRKSPYLTFIPKDGVRPHPRKSDDQRWGRRSLDDVFNMAETETLTSIPVGLGKVPIAIRTKNIRDSPWMGGGPGPGESPKSPKSPGSPTLRKIESKLESNTFITSVGL